MKRYLLCIMTILLSAHGMQAQSYKWVRGGGSTDLLSNGAVREEPVKYICTDDHNNVYVLAQVGKHNIKADTFSQTAYNSFTAWHILLSSYDCNGHMRFAKLMESNEDNFAQGLVYDKGKVYVAGTLYNTGKRIGYDASFSTKYQSAFVAKFDTSGQYNWTRFVGPESYATFYGTNGLYGDLSVDGSGDIHYYINARSGVQFNSSITSQTGIYDLKYSPSGSLLAAIKLSAPDTNIYIKQAQIDKQRGNIYALLYRASVPTGAAPQFLAKYSSSGSLLWIDSSYSIGSGSITSYRVGNDGVYIFGVGSGYSTFSLGGLSVHNTYNSRGGFSVMAKLDFNGSAKWMYHIDGNSGVQGVYGDVLPNGQLGGFGLYNGTTMYGNDSITSLPGGTFYSYLIIMDTSGNLVKLDAIPSGSDAIPTIGVSDKAGNFYMGGYVASTITPPGLSTYTSNGGNSDFFVIKYGYPCNCSGPPTSNFSYRVGTDTVTFTYIGTTPADSVVWDFGDGSPSVNQTSPVHVYTATGSYTACATVYTPCGMHKYCQAVQVTLGVGDITALSGVGVYPNPVGDVLYLKGLSEATPYRLYNTVGRVVSSGILTGNASQINMTSLSPGMYILELTVDGHRGMVRLRKQ